MKLTKELSCRMKIHATKPQKLSKKPNFLEKP